MNKGIMSLILGSMMVFILPCMAMAEDFLYSPLPQLSMTCSFCCYSTSKGKCHQAIDFDTTDNSTAVYAAADGVVIDLRDGKPTNLKGKKVDDYGNFIKIQHPNGYITIYAHLLKGTLTVSKGEAVDVGVKLAIGDNSGWSSGSHLHFEVRDPFGKKVNPYGDPPDYQGGCGPNALWAVCPPVPYDSSFDDKDEDGYTMDQGDCNDNDPDINPDAEEICDHQDNNCNNQTDEYWLTGAASDLSKPCTVGVGDCQNKGSMVCTTDGLATVCSVDAKPSSPEICDNHDNDCDGQTDEDWKTGFAQDIGNPCTVGAIELGECQYQGQMVCTADGKATVCSVDTLSASCKEGEICCDGQCLQGECCLGKDCPYAQACIDHSCQWCTKSSQCDDYKPGWKLNCCKGACSWPTNCCNDEECPACPGGLYPCCTINKESTSSPAHCGCYECCDASIGCSGVWGEPEVCLDDECYACDVTWLCCTDGFCKGLGFDYCNVVTHWCGINPKPPF